MIVQERLRNIRKDLKLNQSEFASKIGITQSYLSKLESGSIEISIETIQSLFEILKVNPTWLIVGQGDMYIPNTHTVNSSICNNGITDNIEAIILSEKVKFLEAQLKEQRGDFLNTIKDLSDSKRSSFGSNSISIGSRSKSVSCAD